MEPGALHYMKSVKNCIYKSGDVPGYEGRTMVINAGAENLDVFVEQYDTLVMINVLEHVQNGIQILRNIYNCLKPGGLLVFNDRWWDSEGPPGTGRKLMELDVLYHPIRMKQAVFDQVSGLRV
jgi:ubiquinone/menaquinone biosynthesis C-methylase UbiE